MYTALIGASYVPGTGDAAMNMSDPINPCGSSLCRATPNGMKGFKNHDVVRGRYGRKTNQSGENWLGTAS